MVFDVEQVRWLNTMVAPVGGFEEFDLLTREHPCSALKRLGLPRKTAHCISRVSAKELPNCDYQKGTKQVINQTNLRMRLIVLIAVSTGMRSAEIHRLRWSDVRYGEGLLAVRSKLKGGETRYVPMSLELAEEIRRYPSEIGQDRIFPPKGGPKSKRQRLEGSFDDLLKRAKIREFWFHDLRHTFGSWYMMNGGDLYELAKLLGHANIKMTERYAKLAKAHIIKTGNTAKLIWNMLEDRAPEKQEGGKANIA